MEDCVGGPKRESRSDGVAFGIEDGDGVLNGRMEGDDEEAVRERERKIANLNEQKDELPISSPTQSQLPLSVYLGGNWNGNRVLTTSTSLQFFTCCS